MLVVREGFVQSHSWRTPGEDDAHESDDSGNAERDGG